MGLLWVVAIALVIFLLAHALKAAWGPLQEIGWCLARNRVRKDELTQAAEEVVDGLRRADQFADHVINAMKPEIPPAPTLMHGFGWALMMLRADRKVARTGWNGKGMWIKLQKPDEHSANTLPYLYIEYPAGHPAYPNGCRVPWLASQTDLLAEDWFVVE